MAKHRSGKGKARTSDGGGEPPEKFDQSDEETPPTWLSHATARYEQRQQGYANLIAGARDAVARDKEQLSNMLSKSEPSDDDEPPPPPIFDDAAKAYQERQKSLGDMFSDALKAKQQEREALSQMFGSRVGKKPPRR